MEMTSREVPSEELRRHLRPLLNSVQRDQEHITITRYEERAAIIVPPDWYERAKAALAREEQGR